MASKTALTLVLCFASCVIVDAKRPNILFIFSDNQGWYDVGYHNPHVITPNINALAKEGVTLNNYYVQPMCSPSRSCLMSGRFTIRTGLQHFAIWPQQANGLPVDEVTLAEKMKEAGYKTHLVGKWHLGFYAPQFLPSNRGFDTFFGMYLYAQDYFNHVFLGGYDLFRYIPGQGEVDVSAEYRGQYSTTFYTTETQKILREHDPQEDDPIFLFLSYQAPHGWFQAAPTKYMDMYDGLTDDLARQTKLAMISAIDESIGNITQTLKDTGHWDNTIIIYSSDNGAWTESKGINWPLRGTINTLWEGAIRAVGFVYSSTIHKDMKGTISNELIHVTDWFPTIVNLAGGNMTNEKPIDGVDQWETIRKGKASPRTELFHNIDPIHPPRPDLIYTPFPGYNGTFDILTTAAIRSGDWKLLTGNPGDGTWMPPPESGKSPIPGDDYPGQHLWLFNIKNDPNEENDVSAENPETVIDLLTRLEYWETQSIPPRFPAWDPNAHPSVNGGLWQPWMENPLP